VGGLPHAVHDREAAFGELLGKRHAKAQPSLLLVQPVRPVARPEEGKREGMRREGGRGGKEGRERREER